MEKGCVHIYCGDGKGKTTAAMGLALRASAAGRKVAILQFLKDGTSSELSTLRNLPGVTVLGDGITSQFVFQMTPKEKQEVDEKQRDLFRQAERLCMEEKCDLLVLDEIMGACATKTMDPGQVVRFLDRRPQGVEVVMTGWDPPEAFLSRADYVTEMVKRKHPYDQGVPARRGIEF